MSYKHHKGEVPGFMQDSTDSQKLRKKAENFDRAGGSIDRQSWKKIMGTDKNYTGKGGEFSKEEYAQSANNHKEADKAEAREKTKEKLKQKPDNTAVRKQKNPG